ncbi:MAG: helix-turn-helix domain-containing protein [Janthinobacterium lividum]
MSTPISKVAPSEYDREFASEMLQTEVFGAFYSLREFRKNNVGLTNAELGRLCGWSRSQVSKLLSGPQNWTLETIAQLASGLGADFRFVLVDRTERARNFNAGGLAYDFNVSRVNGNDGLVANREIYNLTNQVHLNQLDNSHVALGLIHDPRQEKQMTIENYRNGKKG